MVLNQMGANIPYPYHDLPLVSTEDRLGYWSLLGIVELMGDTPPPPTDGKGGTTITLDCGDPPKDRRKKDGSNFAGNSTKHTH
jgi:hypothetical protein